VPDVCSYTTLAKTSCQISTRSTPGTGLISKKNFFVLESDATRLRERPRRTFGALALTVLLKLSLFATINKLGRSPATSVINSPWSVAAKCIALAAGTPHSTQWGQILAQNCDFCLPQLHSTSPLGGFPSEYCHAVWWGKTRMVWLPDG